jgi:hypothetical protein
VRNGTENLYTIPATGGTPTLAVQGGAVSAFQPANGFAVYARSSLVAPTDLYRVATDGTTRQLTNENVGWLSAADLPKPTSLTVTGAAGTPVQYWLLRPPHFDAAKKYPVVFLIHGGPQSSWVDGWSTRWNPALWAAQGWVVAAPNPRGSTGFGQKFVDEISQDWCGKAMTDLDAVFDAVSALPYVDRSRAGIAGASYGGYAVDWIIGHTNRFRRRGQPRRRVQPRVDGARHRRAVVSRVGVRWSRVEHGGSTQLRALLTAPVGQPDPDTHARHHERTGLPRAGRSGSAALHRPAPQWRPDGRARVPE